MATIMDRRTLMMNWEGLVENNDDDLFFESCNRISSAVPLDLSSSRSDNDDDSSDCRLSFASCVSSASFVPFNNFRNLQDYGVWIAEPGDITERRKRLLQGMGLASNRDLIRIASSKIVTTMPRKMDVGENSNSKPELEDSKEEQRSPRILLVRSRSDGDIEFYSLDAKKRKEELIGPVSKQRITRTSSMLIATNAALSHYANSIRISPGKQRSRSSLLPGGWFSTFFLIKDLDTGKGFIVKEYNENGLWNKVSDLETGKQLTMEEFEKSVGYSPVVKELMRRERVYINLDDRRKKQTNSYLSRSFRYSKKRGVSLLKNIKGVANSMSGLIVDKERENSSQWVKVRQQGKSYKEFTALYTCQEIQAHQGSIWTIKFSSDARFLASAGEDRVIHIWEVQECEILSTRPPDDLDSLSGTPVHPMACNISEHPSLAEVSSMPSERRKKGRSSSKRKGNSMPDYVNLPETGFGLSEKPVCTFEGHLDAVLDLSWSREQLLLSSSMDKTVRLWDLETGNCLKLFAHNDYVTCIQFNPADDDFFISGSLDSKVRIWSVTNGHVVDWTDLHEMVTAACYTPDGRGAIVGSHKGNCRLYTLVDYRLEPKDAIHIKKKKKSQAKKITGIQCSPCNPTEVLISSADSRIRIFDESDTVHKFKGLRNSCSQISASFTPEGKFIISASEDNQVFIWKREDPKNPGAGKGKTKLTTHAHEYFQCRDVSVAIPWPGSTTIEPPLVELRSKRHSRRNYGLPRSGITGSPILEERNRHLPPIPRKNNTIDRISSCPDQDLAEYSSRIDSGLDASDSFMSASSPSILYMDSPSMSASLFDGRSSSYIGRSHDTVQANAWGLVIVTATLGGEIRVYQNFGLPLKVSHRPIPSKKSQKDFQV